MNTQGVTVTSHVARDLLQNAAYFNSLPKVVWEYVSNSLDNAREEMPVTIAVELHGSHTLKIADNGSGMSRQDLRRFFQMHAVNVKRAAGKRVRGRFGTGKSAAFGIAKVLVIDTVQNNKRNVVRLTRTAIETAKDGSPFPVEEIVIDESTDRNDGTIVEISDFLIPRLDIEKTIAYIERHLGRYRSRAKVIINDHICQFQEPPYTQKYELTPSPDVAKFIGDVLLLVKVSPLPLDKETNGIDILSQGIWHETTLAGIEGKELSNRLFGEVDVPTLEDDNSEIPAFDNTRNNQLNRTNPRVVILLGWLEKEVEKIRQSLVKDEKEKRLNEEVKKLTRKAKEIEQILNDDFVQIMEEFEIARQITGQKTTRVSEKPGGDGEIWPGEGDIQSKWQEAGQPQGDGHRGKEPPGEGAQPRPGPSVIPGNQLGSQRQVSGPGKRRMRGLFSIEFSNLTSEHHRSKYDSENRTIHINLDHPQIASILRASGGSIDSRQFLEMVYEVAGVEYAQAIQFERIRQGEEVDAGDALFSVRDTIERIARKVTQVLSS